MKPFFFLLILCASRCVAVDVPAVPLVRNGTLLFSDDFERAQLGAAWRASAPSFQIVDGVLKGGQTRSNHGAVAAVAVAFKDAVIEFKFRFEGAASIHAVCDDKAFDGSHAGHICRTTITPKLIRLGDDREGGMRNDILEMRNDPLRKAEGDKLLAGRTQTVPMKIAPGEWHSLRMEIFGDRMRVSVDDRAAGFLQSPGLAHPTKSHFHFTVNGKDALIDDLRIWSAQPANEKLPTP
jgi:hypothetical protein